MNIVTFPHFEKRVKSNFSLKKVWRSLKIRSESKVLEFIMHFRRLERSDLEHFQTETFPPL